MNQAVFPALLADITARDRQGWETYGKALMADDGRDWLLEAYHEALDMAVYLKAALMRREAMRQ